jgi:uncharacterized protein (DUF433 family)
MATVESTLTVPLTVTEFGTIRVGDSRVSLDSVVHHFNLGATPEQIVQSFPSLGLAEVYAAIAYYLTRREEVEDYLRRQEAEADDLRRRTESDPGQEAATAELRRRLAARRGPPAGE